MLRQGIATVTVLVRDYDEAIGWFTEVLGLPSSAIRRSETENAGCWSRRLAGP